MDKLVEPGIYSGVTTDSLELNGITSALNNFGYRCIIGSCNSDTTDTAILTVLISCQDSIQQQPQSNTFYTIPGSAYFSTTHSDTAATYQWQENNGTGWVDLGILEFIQELQQILWCSMASHLH